MSTRNREPVAVCCCAILVCVMFCEVVRGVTVLRTNGLGHFNATSSLIAEDERRLPWDPNYCNQTKLQDDAGLKKTALGQFLGYACDSAFFQCRWSVDGWKTYKKTCRKGLIYDTSGTQACNYDFNVVGCGMKQCSECFGDQFACCLSEECIDIGQRCDGKYDCTLEEDEQNCPTCHPNQFPCVISEQCIPMEKRCNGIKECKDGTDEHHCDECKADFFYCRSSKICVEGERRCDGQRDCHMGEDEAFCDYDKEKDYVCENQEEKISMKKVCDGINHCKDASDELYCIQPQDYDGNAMHYPMPQQHVQSNYPRQSVAQQQSASAVDPGADFIDDSMYPAAAMEPFHHAVQQQQHSPPPLPATTTTTTTLATTPTVRAVIIPKTNAITTRITSHIYRKSHPTVRLATTAAAPAVATLTSSQPTVIHGTAPKLASVGHSATASTTLPSFPRQSHVHTPKPAARNAANGQTTTHSSAFIVLTSRPKPPSQPAQAHATALTIRTIAHGHSPAPAVTLKPPTIIIQLENSGDAKKQGTLPHAANPAINSNGPSNSVAAAANSSGQSMRSVASQQPVSNSHKPNSNSNSNVVNTNNNQNSKLPSKTDDYFYEDGT